MKIIKEIINNLKPNTICSIVGGYGVGKTTILSVISAELIVKGNKVLYLTDELDKKVIISKVFNILKNKKINNIKGSSFVVEEIISLTDVFEDSFKKENFDFVLVDSVYNLGREENLKLLTEKFKCAVIASINLTNPLKYGLNKHKHIRISDLIVNITRNPKISFWLNLKYQILFWLDKPNLNMKVIKNRFGNLSNNYIYLNFKN
jgi:energy-coupling factor transporter ATP-binding protein EcfA2